MSSEPTPAVTDAAVLTTIRAELVDAGVSSDHIAPHIAFDTLALDSLDAEQLLATIKTTYGVGLQQSDIAGLTIGGLASLVASGARS